MSLINDALKKAQKQRTGETPPLAAMPSVGGQPAAQIAHRRRLPDYDLPYRQIGLVAGTVLFLLLGTVYLGRLLQDRPAETTPAKPTKVAGVTPRREPPAAVQGTSGAAPAFVVPMVVPSTPTPSAAPPALAKAKPVYQAPPAPVPEPEPALPAEPPPKFEIKAINFIESLRVAGIRASTTDSKVLMNDRVYRLGNIVEHELGLRLTGITASSLTFEDEHGATYTRNF